MIGERARSWRSEPTCAGGRSWDNPWRRSGLVRGERKPVKKEREAKDDGRYIIFYTFEDEEDAESPSGTNED